MSDDEQLSNLLLLQQFRQLGRELSDTVDGSPVRPAVPTEIGGHPAHGPPLLQRSPHGAPHRGRRAQAVQQQGPATTLAAALVPDHGMSSRTARLMLLRVQRPSIAAGGGTWLRVFRPQGPVYSNRLRTFLGGLR